MKYSKTRHSANSTGISLITKHFVGWNEEYHTLLKIQPLFKNSMIVLRSFSKFESSVLWLNWKSCIRNDNLVNINFVALEKSFGNLHIPSLHSFNHKCQVFLNIVHICTHVTYPQSEKLFFWGESLLYTGNLLAFIFELLFFPP